MARRVIRLEGISGNVLAGHPSSAWWVLPPVAWNGVAAETREDIVKHGARRLAALTGRRVHWRVTSQPVALGPSDPESLRVFPEWSAHHRRVADYVAGRGYMRKVVFLGVELATPANWLTKLGLRKPPTDIEVREISEIISGPGMWGRAATTEELAQLVYQSVRLGHRPFLISHVDGDWQQDDLAQLTSTTEEQLDPYGRSVRIIAPTLGRIDGVLEDRFTAVVTMGRMASSAGWLHDPWLARTDNLPFPVEIAVTADILTPAEVTRRTDYSVRKVRSQIKEALKYERSIDHSLDTGQQAAEEIKADIDAGFADLSARADVWIRLAVSGATEEEALSRAQLVADEYSPQIEIVGYTSTAYREFLPGERLYGGASHRHQLGVTTLAAGMPAAAATVGHDTGIYVGYTSARPGDRSPVFWHPHLSHRLNGQGTAIISGITGAGKSLASATIVTESVRSGATFFVLDPSGPMARLVDLPDLAPHAVQWDLLANPRPGALNPFAIVAGPLRENYETEAEYLEEVTQAQGLRRQLCRDILTSYLPLQAQNELMTRVAMQLATEAVPAERTTSPLQVIEALREVADDVDIELARHARYCAQFIESASREPTGRLIFPRDNELDYQHGEDVRLTVITSRGLSLPRHSDRSRWTDAEARSVPLWALTAWSIERQIFAANRNIPKGVLIDEGYRLTSSEIGQSLGEQLAHDARKHNCRFLLNVHGIQEAERVIGLTNLVDAYFTGRTVSPDAQADALKAMGLPLNVGYESVLGELRNGEFLVKVDGHIERVRVDLGAYPDILENQSTTPDEARVAAVS